MSQHPSRGGQGPYGGPSGWPPTNRNSAPSPVRPPSPFSPPAGQYQQQLSHQMLRGPPSYYAPGVMHHHPQSPVPMSPIASPVFGGQPGFTQRPRWSSPGNSTARPFVPVQQPIPPRSPPIGETPQSPQPCGPPEYLIAPYRSGEYEYVGVPLDPSRGTDDEESGPSTAEIIASQSQDYVDEKLAEYQATISQLQGSKTSTKNFPPTTIISVKPHLPKNNP
ncbi:proline-rich proteoglycan 2-like [Copidosoma floridanum]|uniref:proline-rich proteoglycan 2-like n=1 Tax=Copidosoma floridanum TaxID=29053 RepID=UPI0006C9AE3B|nr:proline-rich proteoglycan 2-like [Copidosoma floridanum]